MNIEFKPYEVRDGKRWEYTVDGRRLGGGRVRTTMRGFLTKYEAQDGCDAFLMSEMGSDFIAQPSLHTEIEQAMRDALRKAEDEDGEAA